MVSQPHISLIIPTRERASYLASALATCTASSLESLEILVLDNASRDDTAQVVDSVADRRVRYLRSEMRLSMRDNFEKGIVESRGRYLGFIGDDDGVFPDTAQRVVSLFESLGVEAVSAARAHYSWPDLRMARAGMGLLPRRSGVERRRSRAELKRLLDDNDYYKLPCVYHNFVARSAIDRVTELQGRFFVSSIVDCASAIALSMLDIDYAFSHSPLVINGGSARSNGAAQFGGGTKVEQANWKAENDIGFLPGFDDTETVGALIVETAVRSSQANEGRALSDIFDLSDVRNTLLAELYARKAAGRDEEDALRMFDSAGLDRPAPGEAARRESFVKRQKDRLSLFVRQRPVDFTSMGISDVHMASQAMTRLIERRRLSPLDNLPAQLRAALRFTGR